MERRAFLAMVTGSLLPTPPAEAQPAGRVYQVGLVSVGTDPARPVAWEPFLDAMRALNYVEGQNLVIRRAFAGGRSERLPGLVSDLVRAKVDVIVTTGTRETLAAKQATSSIPIVMTVVPDPVAQGFVASLSQPGGM